MPDAIIWTTVFSVAGGAASGYIASLFKARETIEAWHRSRSDEADGLAIGILKDLVEAIAAASHSQCWLTWRAKFDPARVSRKDIENYDEEIHLLLPRIFGSLSAISALDPAIADELEEAVRLITGEDYEIGLAGTTAEADRFEALANRYEPAVAVKQTTTRLCMGLGARLLKVKS